MLSAGCAPRHYQAHPIVPAESASRLQVRSLADPGLESYIEANLGEASLGETSLGRRISPWPPKKWDLRMLSLAALYFHPAMESARARLAEAEAAEVTAGARPNPTVGLSPGVPSPYLLNLDFSVPIETAGKRGHRIQSARSLSLAAQLDIADTAWRVRSAVRAALLKFLLASRTLDSLHTEEMFREDQVGMLEKRLAVGLIPRPEVDQARIELAKVKLASATAVGQLAAGWAALASALALPASALDGIDLAWAELDSPPSAESLSPAAIQRNAVLNRLDVRRALAQYAAAEANLQLEIAKQHPDVQIGPGYTTRKATAFSPWDYRRRFLSSMLAAADGSLRTLQEQQVRRTERAVEAGEEDRLALSGVRIEQAVIARGRLDALARAQSALGELEDAVQRPLDPGDAFAPEAPSTKTAPVAKESPREARP